MSVINKMLRDLDARRADGVTPDLVRPAGPGVMQGTASVGVDAGGKGAHRRRSWVALLLLIVAAAAAAWLWSDISPIPGPGTQGVSAGDAQTQPTVAVLSPAPAAETTAPESPAPATPAIAPEPAQGHATKARPLAATADGRPLGGARKARPAREAVAMGQSEQGGTAVATVGSSPPRNPQGKREAQAAAAPQPAPVSSDPAVTQPVTRMSPGAPVPAPQRQVAVQETLAQSQSLWATGSRDAALDLMREAVALAERAPDTPVGRQALTALVRELVRMELAQGQARAVLDLLVRQEAALSGQADLWAVRGNAAQRLGRHAESVQAYQRALQLRPHESRWLLGAAVSLAALGQLEAAAQHADKARSLGVVSPEVLAYLRQVGVPLK